MHIQSKHNIIKPKIAVISIFNEILLKIIFNQANNHNLLKIKLKFIIWYTMKVHDNWLSWFNNLLIQLGSFQRLKIQFQSYFGELCSLSNFYSRNE